MNGIDKKRVIIYGCGKFFREMKSYISKKYEVIAKYDRGVEYIEENVSLEAAFRDLYDYVIIMIVSIKDCLEVINQLIKKYHVPYEKIMLGHNLKYRKLKTNFNLNIDSQGNIIFFTGHYSIKIKNEDQLNNIKEIFENNCYGYHIEDSRKEVVIDIGMNIGGASLYFLGKSNVVKVYAYEPFLNTYRLAQENFERNSYSNSQRIEFHPYGISDVNKDEIVIYNENMSCGQSTNLNLNEKARQIYQKWEMLDSKADQTTKIKLKDVNEVLMDIYKKHSEDNIVIKMDCEGEEYRILERMDKCKLFSRINIIMLEWHYQGEDQILEILKRNSFSYWHFKEENNIGIIYAYRK